MCVWEHACLAAWHWLMVMISLESLSLVSNISVSDALEMTIHFYYPTLELFCFSFTQPFTYSKFSLLNPFSSVPPPAINNERSLREESIRTEVKGTLEYLNHSNYIYCRLQIKFEQCTTENKNVFNLKHLKELQHTI